MDVVLFMTLKLAQVAPLSSEKTIEPVSGAAMNSLPVLSTSPDDHLSEPKLVGPADQVAPELVEKYGAALYGSASIFSPFAESETLRQFLVDSVSLQVAPKSSERHNLPPETPAKTTEQSESHAIVRQFLTEATSLHVAPKFIDF
jgi:hypothetical protein